MDPEDVEKLLLKSDKDLEKAKLIDVRLKLAMAEVEEFRSRVGDVGPISNKDADYAQRLLDECRSLKANEKFQQEALEKDHELLGGIIQLGNNENLKDGQGTTGYRAPPNISIDLSAKLLAQKWPKIWDAVNVKYIEAPSTHHGFKAVSVALSAAIAELMLEPREAASNIAGSASMLARYNFPTYYVSSALTQAMQKSHPPTGMSWDDLSLPYPGMIFMLPKNQVKEPDGSDVAFVAFAKHLANEPIKIIGLNQTFVNPWKENRYSVFWSVGNCLQSQDCTFSGSQLLEPDPNYIAEATDKRSFTPKDERPSDPSFASSLCGLVANLILLKMARPEMVEVGERTKKKLKSGTPIHRPTWIGRKYEVIRKLRAEAGGCFTELDWRSGHYKLQHFGVGKKESKVIFVDPYIAYVRGLIRK